jgi:hypothetical protein
VPSLLTETKEACMRHSPWRRIKGASFRCPSDHSPNSRPFVEQSISSPRYRLTSLQKPLNKFVLLDWPEGTSFAQGKIGNVWKPLGTAVDQLGGESPGGREFSNSSSDFEVVILDCEGLMTITASMGCFAANFSTRM